ncbi:MAG: GtrA family protein [Paludibacteraceae bacterium]
MELNDFLNKILKEKSGNLYVQVFRYLISGGTAFLIDTLTMILLKEVFAMYFLYASIISFIIGLIFTYLLSIYWVFDRRRLKENQLQELIIFVLIGLVGIVLTWFFMSLFTDKLALYYVVSKVLTTIIVSIWNFVAKKMLLFTTKKNEYEE